MKAVRYHARGDLRIEEVPDPPPPGPREVLVTPRHVGICGTDLHEFAHGPIVTCSVPHRFTGASLPQILGHEFSATVEAVGRDVTHVRPGDPVSIQPLVVPLDDHFSRRGLHQASPDMATIGLQTSWGGLAERAPVNDYNVFRLGSDGDLRLGALFEPAAVALSGVDRAEVRAGGSVLVVGGGPIGALTAMVATACGAALVAVSEPNPGRRRRIAELDIGALVLDPADDGAFAALRARTDGRVGVDSAIECSGTEAGLGACLAAVRPCGTVAQVGIHPRPARLDPTLWASKSLTIRGSWGFPITSWPRILGMVERGLLPVGRIVSREIAMDDIVAQGFRALLAPGSADLKVLVAVG